MSFNEKRDMQDLYRDQKDDTLYKDSRAEADVDKHKHEENLKIERRTATSGNAHRGRRQDGVKVLSGNPNAVFSDTRADDARHKFYVTGVAIVNEEASKIDGAPIAPAPEDVPFENPVGSPDTMEGEV